MEWFVKNVLQKNFISLKNLQFLDDLAETKTSQIRI